MEGQFALLTPVKVTTGKLAFWLDSDVTSVSPTAPKVSWLPFYIVFEIDGVLLIWYGIGMGGGGASRGGDGNVGRGY